MSTICISAKGTDSTEILEEYHTRRECYFSNKQHKDTFLLRMVVSGKDFENAKVYFCVKNYKNKFIFTDTLKGLSLFTYSAQIHAEGEKPTNAELGPYILDGFYHFFDDMYFFSPPIEKNAEYSKDDDLVDYVTWKSIKNNPKAIAFTYTILEESIVNITYMKNTQKVVEF